MIENQTVKDRLKDFIKYLGIGQSKFEKKCNLSNGYINNSKGNFGASKLEYILKLHPELNREWLLYGEGDMLKSSINQEGEHNTQVIGDGNHINTPSTIDAALQEIAAQRKLVERAYDLIEVQININKEQNEKYLSIIDNLLKK